ncbi:MAG: endolytic transglycosylase MltG [Flavobacteriales bacterium]
MKTYKIITVFVLVLFFGIAALAYKFYTQIYSSLSPEAKYITIPKGASFEDVIHILDENELIKNKALFLFLAEQKNYNDSRVNGGRYEIEPETNLNELINKLRIGDQTPLSLKFREAEHLGELAKAIAKNMELDSAEFVQAIYDPKFLESKQLTKANVSQIFIPNTYEVYWNWSAGKLRDRLYEEYERFWNASRIAKAKKLNLSKKDVTTLASIVKKESYVSDEFSTIAGLYYNRLQRGMPLQSDPTILYVIKQTHPHRKRKRVLYKDLKIESPYNTYLHTGLPPGPIAIPSIKHLDAVLNLKKHKYIYMCANPSLDGRHAFAVTDIEHQRNARRYHQAMDSLRILR